MPPKKYPDGIVKLETFWCQKATSFGNCEDMADFRVTQNGVSIALCSAHAQPYVRGDLRLDVVKCRFCSQTIQPGNIFTHDGDRYCAETCYEKQLYRTREVYR